MFFKCLLINGVFFLPFYFRCNEFIASEFTEFPEMHRIITLGLCATKEWKRALELNGQISNSSRNILIRKSIRENEIEIMWQLLNDMKKFDAKLQYIAPKTCITIAKHFERYPKNIDENAASFFRVCETIEHIFDEKSAHEFTRALQRLARPAHIVEMDFS